MTATIALNDFTRAYVEAALDTSTDADGRVLRERFGIADIPPAILDFMTVDCATFQKEEAMWLFGIDAEAAGKAFYYARCGHGDGFWELDRSDIGEPLMQAVEDRYGPTDLYLDEVGAIRMDFTSGRLEVLADEARPKNDDDWGTDRQITAENRFFWACAQRYPHLFHDASSFAMWCLKATTEEMLDEALRIIREQIGQTAFLRA